VPSSRRRAQRPRPFAFLVLVLVLVFFDEEEADAFLAVVLVAVDLLAAGRVPAAFLEAAFFEVADLAAADFFVAFLVAGAFEDLRADVAPGDFAALRDPEVGLDAFFAVPVFLAAPARLDPTTVSVPGPGMMLVSSPESQRTRRRAPLLADTLPRRGVSPILRPATSIASPTLTMRASRDSSANAQRQTGSRIGLAAVHIDFDGLSTFSGRRGFVQAWTNTKTSPGSRVRGRRRRPRL
jgi:hypothetical protein